MAEKSFSGKIIVNGTAINIGNGSSGSSSTASGIEPYIIYMSHADFSVFTNTATDQFQNDGNTNSNQTKVLQSKKDGGTSSTKSSTSSITDNEYLSYDTFGYAIQYGTAIDSDKKLVQEIITAFFTGRPIYLYLNTPYRYTTSEGTSADDYYEYIRLNNYIGSNATGTTDDTTNIYLTFKHNNNELLYIHLAGTGDRVIDDFDRTYVLYFKDVPNDIADLNGFVENDSLIGKWATTAE